MMAGVPARAATRLEIIMSVLERVFVLTWGGQSIRSSRTNRGGETKGEQIKITTSLPNERRPNKKNLRRGLYIYIYGRSSGKRRLVAYAAPCRQLDHRPNPQFTHSCTLQFMFKI